MAGHPRSHAGGGGAGGSLTQRRRPALLEVALLAKHLHWSRTEILALPVAEYRTYLTLIVESLREEPQPS